MILRIRCFGLDMTSLGFEILILHLANSPRPVVANIQIRHSLHFLSGSRCINLLPTYYFAYDFHCQSHTYARFAHTAILIALVFYMPWFVSP